MPKARLERIIQHQLRRTIHEYMQLHELLDRSVVYAVRQVRLARIAQDRKGMERTFSCHEQPKLPSSRVI